MLLKIMKLISMVSSIFKLFFVTFKGGSKWQNENKLTDVPNIGLCYQVSTDEFIPVKYQVGSGYQG